MLTNLNESVDFTPEERHKYTFYEASNCTKENFIIPDDLNYDNGYDGKELLEEWEGYSLICPNVNDKIMLQGTQ